MNLPDIEVVSERVHQAWMESKLRNGIASRVFDQTGGRANGPLQPAFRTGKGFRSHYS